MPTDSEVAAIKVALNCWEWFEYISTAIVFVGCVGEFLAEFTSLVKSHESRHRLARLSLIILILGIAGELLGTVRTSQLSGQLIANIEERAAGAQREAGEANDRASVNEREVEAERTERLKLQAKVAPRRLSSQQKELLARRVSDFKSRSIFISCVNGGTETRDYAQDFVEVFSIPALKFKVQHATCSQILAPGFSPVPIQIEAGADRQKDANTLVKALIEIGVNNANITRRSNDNKAILALTIGPKPTS